MPNISFYWKFVVLKFFMLSLELGAQTCNSVVAKDNSGSFRTISEAINGIPDSCAQGYEIKIKQGFYEEIVVIPKNKTNLRLIGDGMSTTVVSGSRSTSGGYGTDSTGTLTIKGNGFTAIDITFQNVAGPNAGPACAMVTDADHLTFFRCQFLGYQDTIYTKSGTLFFRDCEVQGSIDFICGDGSVVLQNSKIAVHKPMPEHFNTITAQKRDVDTNNTGIVIHNCTIVPDPDFKYENTTQTFLGRPWGQFSRTVVMTSFLDSFIEPSGWTSWSSTSASASASTGSIRWSTSAPPNVGYYYAEFSNFGPGAITTKRVTWSKVIPDSEAEYFTVKNFLRGDTWIPNIVPVNLGL